MTQYPYLPEGKTFKFALASNPFMAVAKEAQETKSGDQIYPVGASLVKDGRVIATAGNGFNLGAAHVHICPRVVLECKTGEGYDLCHHHDGPGHAEQQVLKTAREQGLDTRGADLYMYGHWWACEPCWNAMIEAGINNVYLLENADVEFSRDRVYAKTLVPSMKNIYLSCGLTNTPAATRDLYDALKKGASELDVEMYCPHEHTDPLKATTHSPKEIYEVDKKRVQESGAVIAVVTWPSLGVGIELEWAASRQKPIVLLSEKGSKVSRAALGLPGVVYHIEYEGTEMATRHLKNVLKQL